MIGDVCWDVDSSQLIEWHSTDSIVASYAEQLSRTSDSVPFRMSRLQKGSYETRSVVL